jgi:curli biogenesis system outer membrane secretion channel CsgG
MISRLGIIGATEEVLGANRCSHAIAVNSETIANGTFAPNAASAKVTFSLRAGCCADTTRVATTCRTSTTIVCLGRIPLANDLMLQTAMVMGTLQLEVTGTISEALGKQLKAAGCFTEIIRWLTR